MRGSPHPWLIFGITCSIVAMTSGVEAQAWLSDRKRAEGAGIRVGDLELHPGLGAELGWISNVYNAESPENGERDEVLPSAVLRLSPHLFVSTLGAERSGADEGEMPGIVQFKGGLSAALQTYFADDTPETEFGTDLNLELTLAPRRPISFRLIEILNRSFRPFADPVDTPLSTSGSGLSTVANADFVRYNETIGAHLDGRSKGGLLSGGLGYRLSYNWFDDDAYVANNNLNHTVDLTGAWEFLPKSALFYDAAYTHRTYTNEDTMNSMARTPLIDSDQITTRIGFNGAVTSRISATLAVGYAVGFFDDDNDFEGLTVNAEGRWLPTPVSELGLGYERGFMAAYQGNFVERNQIYLRLRHMFGGAFVVGSKLAVEFLDFGPDTRTMQLTNQDARSDVRYSADLNGEYRFIDWLAVTAQVSALIDDTDFITGGEFELADGSTVTFEDPAKFTTLEAWIGVRAFY